MTIRELIEQIVSKIPDSSARNLFQNTRGNYGSDVIPQVPKAIAETLWRKPIEIPLVDCFVPMTETQVINDKRMLDELLESGNFAVPPGEPAWWKSTWWPFATDGGGQYLCWDEENGQVIEFVHDAPQREIKGASLDLFFGQLLAEIQDGVATWAKFYGWKSKKLQHDQAAYAHKQSLRKKTTSEVDVKRGIIVLVVCVLIIACIVIFLWGK